MEQDTHTLEQQYQGLQQMFGHVLKELGHPVEVSKEELAKPLGNERYMIEINETDNSFIFSLTTHPVEVEDGQ